MEYLRAINRIHRYFVDHDPSLETYYYWAPCDYVPFHGGGSTAVTGLLDVIAALNSLFMGILVGVMVYALWPSLDLVIYAASGIVAGGITWIEHSRFEVHSLRKAEREAQEYVRFPRTEG